MYDKMEDRAVYQQKIEKRNEEQILLALKQPLTAKQIAGKTSIPEYTCSYLMAKFVKNGLTLCINPKARNSRLYWLTKLGRKYRKNLCNKSKLSYIEYDLENIDWHLYGWVCFNHRSMVIKFLTEAMQPSKVKRILRLRKANIRISANNIRDVIRLLLSKGIVRPVKVKKKAHLRYELTELGIKFRQLLIQAEQRL